MSLSAIITAIVVGAIAIVAAFGKKISERFADDSYDRLRGGRKLKKLDPFRSEEEPALLSIRGAIESKAPPSSELTAPATDKVLSDVSQVTPLTYGEILAEVQRAPPLQRPVIVQRYSGQVIDWTLLFVSGTQIHPGSLVLYFATDATLLAVIQCEVETDKYPQLQILPQGASVRVLGTIECGDPFRFVLRNCQLTF